MNNRKKQKLFLLATRLILLSAILWLSGSLGLSFQTSLSDSSLKKLVRNFEYTLSTGFKYKLADGCFKQGRSIEDYVNIRLDSFISGDLNGDGRQDAAVVLVSNYGGSGFFYELTALINDGLSFHQTNSLELGDRVEIKKIRINQEKVIIDLLTQGPDDPSCCPSKKVNLVFQFRNGQLYETK
ncbi:MAG: hypothetical protein ACPLZD_10760 [Candidatus Saccharicenans sp.]|nr:MAG: hypothetical protein C0168_06940 [Candidatus Aminicenantes bacterium]